MSFKNRFKGYIFESGLVILTCVLGVINMTRDSSQFPNLVHVQAIAPVAITPIPSPPIYPEIGVQSPQGVPAITPSQPDAIPAFTEDEIYSYVMSHPAGKSETQEQFRIGRVDCALTSSDVSKILKYISTGLPDTTSVCYVELEGSFTFFGPFSQMQGERIKVTYSKAFEVFDAKTGNLLLDGGFVLK